MIATASVRSPWRRAGRRYISLALIAVALIAAACGGDDDNDDAARGASTAPPAGAATAAPAGGGGGTAAGGGGAATAGFAAGDLIEGAGAYDWRVTLVADGTKPGIGGKCCPFPHMALPKILRDKHLHGAPQQFVPAIPENRLGLFVDQNDLALLVDDDHGVGRRVE